MLETGQLLAARLATFVAVFLAASFVAQLLVLSVSPTRLRSLLAGSAGRSTLAALVLGALTPFCSCSTVPIVAGMRASGVPLLATTAFLVVSPLVNPATVALLSSFASPWLAGGFVAMAMVLALIVALAVSALGVEPKAAAFSPLDDAHAQGPWRDRALRAGEGAMRDLRRLLPVLLVVAPLGLLLYGRVDIGLLGRMFDAVGPFGVPLAVLVGVPVYASTAFLLPLGSALIAGGASLGVVSAFLVGATGLSLPEGLLLHRVMGGPYLRALLGTFVLAAVALGYLVELASAGVPPQSFSLR